jgi:hypothetical protein
LDLYLRGLGVSNERIELWLYDVTGREASHLIELPSHQLHPMQFAQIAAYVQQFGCSIGRDQLPSCIVKSAKKGGMPLTISFFVTVHGVRLT